MTEYGPHDMPAFARMFVVQALAVEHYILKDNGHILNFAGELVARLVRVVVHDGRIEWYVQQLRGITVVEFEV